MTNETKKTETPKEKYLREQAEMRARNIEFLWSLLTDKKTDAITYHNTKRKLQDLGEI
jgi:hypothetical protein